MIINVRVRAHSEYHNLPDGTLGVVRAWAVHRSGHNAAIITTPNGKFDCVPIGLLTLVSDAEQTAPEPSTVVVDTTTIGDFAEWLEREMPSGTVISDPIWWAGRIAARFAKAGGGQ